MLYYKVNTGSDQTRIPNSRRTNILVAHELYTEKEVNKLGFSDELKSVHFHTVEIPRKETFFFFGVRKSNYIKQAK